MAFWHPSRIVNVIRATLVLALLVAIWEQRWSAGFVAVLTFALSMVPEYVGRRLGVRLPLGFIAAITFFLFATLFLGEVLDFYNRFWWWDVVLHGGSAMGFGLIGVIFALFLFEGDRYAAPPWALSLIGFTFAMTIGAVWEIFEFAMDQSFGMTMQKNGLVDTMWDLIVDAVGAATAAIAGFFYVKGREMGGVAAIFTAFIAANRRFFRKFR